LSAGWKKWGAAGEGRRVAGVLDKTREFRIFGKLLNNRLLYAFDWEFQKELQVSLCKGVPYRKNAKKSVAKLRNLRHI
jgi:hypothetical protein